jgi:hypothetical protein
MIKAAQSVCLLSDSSFIVRGELQRHLVKSNINTRMVMHLLASVAIRLTNLMPLKNPSNSNVGRIVCAR